MTWALASESSRLWPRRNAFASEASLSSSRSSLPRQLSIKSLEVQAGISAIALVAVQLGASCPVVAALRDLKSAFRKISVAQVAGRCVGEAEQSRHAACAVKLELFQGAFFTCAALTDLRCLACP